MGLIGPGVEWRAGLGRWMRWGRVIRVGRARAVPGYLFTLCKKYSGGCALFGLCEEGLLMGGCLGGCGCECECGFEVCFFVLTPSSVRIYKGHV